MLARLPHAVTACYHANYRISSSARRGTGMADSGIGKFQVLSTLGTGAHSTILHIRRNADSKHYALKIVPIEGPDDQKFLEQAEHEFRVAHMLDHPNLVKIHQIETQRDWLFRTRKVQLLIEYVNGRTLDTFKVIPVPKLVQIFERIASALVHMHRRSAFHADLKPNNIMLSRAGEVKIIDYGLAWIKGEPKGRVQGTPEYMAPETASHRLVNERTDIYNFGATMYRLVTFRLPPSMVATEPSLKLTGKSWAKLFKPVQEFNTKAPPELCELIQRCLQFDAMQRPERVSEVQGALDHLAEKLVRKPEDKLEAMEWEE
jgi:serine/threonine protein kinase